MLAQRRRRWANIGPTSDRGVPSKHDTSIQCWTNVGPPSTHRSNVGPMLAQRRRRWANIGPTLDRCVVFAGFVVSNQRGCLLARPAPEQFSHLVG